MNDQVTYEYSSCDRLEQRNTYFYSRFQGHPFLAAWRESRELLQRSTPGDLVPRVEDDQLPSETATGGKLIGVVRDIEEGRASEALQTLDKLVQRFEVTKRLHAAYTSAWRPENQDDYRDLANYVLFAEALHLAYSTTLHLPYLNALLKCLDTLTSVRHEVPAALLERLSALVLHERQHVAALAEKLGVVE